MVAAATNGSIEALFGTGGGNLCSGIVLDNTGASGVAVGDVDGDGRPDVAGGNELILSKP